MGYNTTYDGVLKFSQPLTLEQYKDLTNLLEDYDEYKIWGWQITEDETGIEYDGSEKVYVEHLEEIIATMRDWYPLLKFQGELLCQGEDVGDVYTLYTDDNGDLHKKEYVAPGATICCPHCQKTFTTPGEKNSR